MDKSSYKKALAMARASVFDEVEYLGEWNGSEVFMPISIVAECCTGFPQFILTKNGKCRWASSETESRALLATFFNDN